MQHDVAGDARGAAGDARGTAGDARGAAAHRQRLRPPSAHGVAAVRHPWSYPPQTPPPVPSLPLSPPPA
eukprot:1110011-Pyramimonas_sp.AAC.2